MDDQALFKVDSRCCSPGLAEAERCVCLCAVCCVQRSGRGGGPGSGCPGAGAGRRDDYGAGADGGSGSGAGLYDRILQQVGTVSSVLGCMQGSECSPLARLLRAVTLQHRGRVLQKVHSTQVPRSCNGGRREVLHRKMCGQVHPGAPAPRHTDSSGASSREREQLQISCLFVGTRQDRRIDAATAAARDVIPASIAL